MGLVQKSSNVKVKFIQIRGVMMYHQVIGLESFIVVIVISNSLVVGIVRLVRKSWWVMKVLFNLGKPVLGGFGTRNVSDAYTAR